ncbi:MAG: AAA family ATPase [Acidobacteria bacterium]|nr:AAA family ATPase [Acidobacteriota bacterium]
MFKITLPDPSLILLLGASGAGKSTFARRHFQATEIISSDHCRALICDDENNQAVNAEAFALLHHLTQLRLQWNKLTVIDATNLQTAAREPLLKIAQEADISCVALVLNISTVRCVERNRNRIHRVVPDEVIEQHQRELLEARARLPHEGYAALYELSETEIAETRVERIFPLKS